MKYLILIAIALLPAFARADAVDDSLGQLPAATTAQEQKLAADLLKPDLLPPLLKKLVPPGTGDDTKVRYAVAALTRHASRPDAEADRAAYAKAIIEFLPSSPDPEITALLLQQLQFVGHDEAVSPVAAYLLNENRNLAQSAASALVGIASPAAAQAVAKALSTAPSEHLPLLLHAAADLHAEAAAEAVRKHCAAENPAVRAAALHAAASIPLPDAAPLLSQAIQASQRSSDRAANVALYLLFAQRRAQTGHADEAATLCRDLYKTSEKDPSVRCAALFTLVRSQKDQALNDLLAAATSNDAEVRHAALELAAKIPGDAATRKWMEAAGHAPPDARAQILAMLGDRRDAVAIPALVAGLGDADAEVRAAAIPALARLAGPAAIPELLKFLTAANGPDVQHAVDALARMGDAPLAASAAALANVSPAARVALLDMLGTRAARSQAAAILAQARSDDAAVRVAAIRAMGRVATEKDLATLVGLAASAKSDAEESAALKAVASTAATVSDPAARSAALIAALPQLKDARRAAFLRTLAKVGGQPAIDAIVADLAKSTTFDPAARALADATDPAALPHLQALAKNEKTDTAHYVLAIRGIVNIVKTSSLPAEQKLSALKEALSSSRRADEKKLVISALATERSPESLALIVPFLDDADLKQEASLAAIRLVLPQKQGEQPLRGDAARQAVEKAIPACPDAKLKQQAERYLASAPQ